MSEYRDKLESIGFPRRTGQAERIVERHDGAILRTTKHWDGRQDATVTPDVIRYGARMHRTGRKRGRTAEVRELTNKERGERYGPSG